MYEAIRRAIDDGRLSPDDELPSTRELARDLCVGRNTIVAAYELLVAEGYAISRGGAGTFVAWNGMAPQASPERTSIEPRPLSSLADLVRVLRLPPFEGTTRPFRPSSPAADVFPYGVWAKFAAHTLRHEQHLWMWDGDPAGDSALRKAIARHLHAFRSSACEPDQIVVTAGAQLALLLCATLLIDPDDPVWIEEPAYQQAQLLFRSRSGRLIPVPLDDDGLDIEAGKALSPHPRLIYTTPTHQWPSGIEMTLARKRALVQFAAERDAWVIEDDYDGDLRFDRRAYASLQSLDVAQRVIHVGTFSKTLTPGLRLGYAALPYDLVDAFVGARQLIDRYSNPITQAILARFIETGTYARHVYAMQDLYQERHELLRARIASKLGGFLTAEPARGGTFTVTRLAQGYDDVALADAFHAEGYESIALSRLYAGQSAKRGLLLGHAVAKPEEIRRGVDVLARIASSPRPPAGTAFSRR